MAAYTFDDIPKGANTIGILVNVYANFSRKLIFGIIDTGCSHTCISEELATEMNLVSRGEAKYNVVGGDEKRANKYIVGVTIDSTVPFGEVEVGSYPKAGAFYDVIIGMDLLSKCDFAVTSANGHMKFTIENPSKRDLDFTKE